MKKMTVFLSGLVVGIIALGLAIYLLAPGMMLSERKSAHDLDETVKLITKAAKAEGWTVSGVRKLDESVRKHGGPDLRAVRLVDLCHAQHAGKILVEDDARVVSVLMPCTISVYEKSDGSVWVGHMNPGLMGRVFGGVIAEVMSGPVAESQARFVDSID
ncbi:MAG: DUF302 domain-containing protein [Planctomycetota bacterium]